MIYVDLLFTEGRTISTHREIYPPIQMTSFRRKLHGKSGVRRELLRGSDVYTRIASESPRGPKACYTQGRVLGCNQESLRTMPGRESSNNRVRRA